MRISHLLYSSVLLCLQQYVSAQRECIADKIPHPEYFGTKVINIQAKEVRGYHEWNFIDHMNVPFPRDPIEFCNVTITYTHSGLNDEVNIYVWLPLEGWNGRFFGQGGGGWTAGWEGALAPAVGLKYAAANTDAGHTFFPNRTDAVLDAKRWALASPGNVNWVLLHNFASIAYDDMTHLAKSVVESFYGSKPKYSYFNGCSTGGRQGLVIAQRYPENYDGIVAAAPGINFDNLLVAFDWGQVVMRKENYFPPTCEFEAIRQAAIEACDETDGVKDGVIAAPGLCNFDAESVIGRKYDCDGDTRKISKPAARIANKAWDGPRRPNGKREWFGTAYQAQMGGSPMLGGMLQTLCDEDSNNCRGAPHPLSNNWFKYFLAKDPNYDPSTMTEDDLFRFFQQSRQEYKSIMGCDDPDLSRFRAAGGKMITWHGLADHLIFPNGSSDYYERVLASDPDAADFYRYFEAPGVAHCSGGVGAYPGKVLQALVDWVEHGKAPEYLEAATVPAAVCYGANCESASSSTEAVKHRKLCPYPKVAAYIGGDPNEASSFECADSFGTQKAVASEHTEL